MNISSVSFTGINHNQERGYNEPKHLRVNNNRFHNPQRMEQRDKYDTRKTTEQKRTERPKQSKKTASTIKGLTAALTAALMIHCGVTMGNEPYVIKVPYNPQETSITEIAEKYGCPEDIIRAYNNIDIDSPLDEIEELKIPTEYDYLQPQIDEMVEKLFSSKLSLKERSELENTIDAMRAKRQAQKQVAKVYTDGKKIYYIIDFTDENGKSVNGSINVELFKILFDIKEHAIRDNNKLEYVWKQDSNMDEGKGYFDYTGNYFVSGDKIVVQKGDIKEKDVDLQGFI